jgi:hypothetical protein
MAERNHEEAALGMSRHDRGTVRAAMQQGLAIEKRDIPVIQFVVVAEKAVFLENRRDAFIEKTRITIGPERRQRGQQQHGGKSSHYCFMPMPN